jgi:hypothetical protein
VDGNPVGAPLALLPGGTVSSGPLTDATGSDLAPGAHLVTADFTPAAADTYATSSSTPQTLTVAQAATTTSVAVAPKSLTATVSVSAPGAGNPGGSVTFTVDGLAVGTATVADGSATLAYTTPAGRTRQVGATYSGSATMLGSSGSTARSNPVVTAEVTSTIPRTRYGWYRAPVTVSFTCTAGSAPLAAGCPAPVTLTRDGAAQSVTRTVTATDGGVATVAVGGLNLDRTAPSAKVAGVRSGARYFASSPTASCLGADRLSGVASCTVRKQRSGQSETITATAVDKAGNATSSRVTVAVVPLLVEGAPYANGSYTLRRGHTYTILVVSKTRPRYVDAALYPRNPSGLDHWFTWVGPNRWALGVTMDRGMRTGYWNLGVKTGASVQKVRVYVRS